MRLLEIILFLILSPMLLWSQDGWRLQNLTVADGLPSNFVTSICQDSLGFIWIGTNNGLSRYDGYKMLTLRSLPIDSTSLPHRSITDIVSDGQLLWVGTSSGLGKLDLKTLRFHNYGSRAYNLRGLPAHHISFIFRDQKDRIWIGTNRGLAKYLSKADSFAVIQGPNHSERIWARQMTTGPDGRLWLATMQGIYEVSDTKGTNMLTRFLDREGAHIGDAYFNGLAWYNSDSLLLSTTGGLFLHHHNQTENIAHTLGQIISKVYMQSDKTAWYIVYQKSEKPGIFYINPRSHQRGSVLEVPAAKFYQTIEYDNSNGIWFDTYNFGAYRMQKPISGNANNNTPFHHITLSDSTREGFSQIWVDDQNLPWITTRLGQIMYRQNNKTVQSNIRIPFYDPSGFIPDITRIDGADDGRIWCMGNQFLAKVDSTTNNADILLQAYHFRPPTKKQAKHLLSGIFLDLIKADNGWLWIGATRRLYIYHPANDTVFTIELAEKLGATFTKTHCQRLYFDRHGNLWIGTYNQGILFIPSANFDNLGKQGEWKYRHYQANAHKGYRLSDDMIHDIAEDSSGNLWIGTAAGLNRLNPRSETIDIFSEEEGLPHASVSAIKVDHNGSIWVATQNGLAFLRNPQAMPDQLELQNYSIDDGLGGDQYEIRGSSNAPDGTLYFLGRKHLVWFHPDSITINLQPPPVRITTVRIDGKSAEFPVNQRNSNFLEMAYQHKLLAIEFAALDFQQPQKNQYAYRLVGFDDQWTYVNPLLRERQAVYTNLNPGEYQFEVRGSNNDGVWSKEPASMQIIIPPPFWMTWWFRLLMILLIATIPVLIYRNRLNQLLQLERLRVRIASDLHDDIGTSLSSIAMQAELVQKTTDQQRRKSGLQEIAFESRNMIGTMRDVVWSLDARNDNIGSLIARMKELGERILNPVDITLLLSKTGLDSNKKLSVTLRQNLYLIFKEAITNSAKYAQATAIQVTLSNANDQFIMLIEDNGIGLSPDRSTDGSGMRNMKMRAEAIGGELELQNSNGLTVTLKRKAI